MSEFKNYHPLVNFIYFIAVIAFSVFFMHPVCLLISFVSGFSYSVMLKGKKAIKFNLVFLLPMLIFTALLNPAFNHQGVTILTYLPDGNPLTLESVYYGIAAAVMMICVISWFSCYNEIMTSDKFIYLFGKVIPSFSLILSMTLRFVPRFKVQFGEVVYAQKCLGRDIDKGKLITRAKNLISIISVMITWSLENAIETADSMKSRGYGLSGRTAFSIYKFSPRDVGWILYIFGLSAVIITSYFTGNISFVYFPAVKYSPLNLKNALAFISYFMLAAMPFIIEIREELKWKH